MLVRDAYKWKNYRSGSEQGKQYVDVRSGKVVALIVRSDTQPPSKQTEYMVVADDHCIYIHGMRAAKALVYELLMQAGVKAVAPL